MKSKILSLLAMTFIIPCAFLFGACNFGNPMDNINSNVIEVENGKYALQGDKATFVGLVKKGVSTFDMKSNVQDSEGKNYIVSEIGDYAFQKCSNLTTIVFPDSITKINDCIFSECTSLKSVIIPNSVEYIGRKTFIHCSSLENVVLPESLTDIKEGMFINCLNLNDIVLPSTIVEISESAFQNCRSLTGITLPDSLTTLKSRAFNNCVNLNTINLPEKLKTVGKSVFQNCDDLHILALPKSLEVVDNDFLYDTKLTKLYINSQNAMNQDIYNQNTTIKELIIGGDVVTIPENFFANSKRLQSLAIGKNVQTLKEDTFFHCPITILKCDSFSVLTSKSIETLPIEDLMIGGSISEIPNSTFKGNSYLKKLQILDGVKVLHDDAFSACNNLMNISFPNSITSIGSRVFSHTSWFENQADGMIYIGDIAYKFKGEMSVGASVSLESGTTSIADSAFENCSNLEQIDLPNTLKYIGANSFSGCSTLENVIIPSSVTLISKNAFSFCTSLNALTLNEGLQEIQSNAFDNCTSLTNIIIPNSIKILASDAFKNTAWYNNQENGVVYLGEFALNFKSSGAKNQEIIIKDSIKKIADKAFLGQNDISKISLPDSLTSIGAFAFKDCANLTEINIPKNVAFVDKSAFVDCKMLKTVYIDSLEFAKQNDLNLNTLFNNVETLFINKDINVIAEYIRSNFDFNGEDTINVNYIKYTKKSI